MRTLCKRFSMINVVKLQHLAILASAKVQSTFRMYSFYFNEIEKKIALDKEKAKKKSLKVLIVFCGNGTPLNNNGTNGTRLPMGRGSCWSAKEN
jgi:hypothetical protein